MNPSLKILLPILLFTKFSLCSAYTSLFVSDNHQPDSLKTGWYFVVNSNGYKIELEKTNKVYHLNPIPFISKKDIKSVEVFLIRNEVYGLEMDFNNKATKIWEVATDKSFKEYSELAFVLNGKLIYTAIAKHGKISNGKSAIIREDYSKTEIEKIKSFLQLKE
jgi:hypothetical protein